MKICQTVFEKNSYINSNCEWLEKGLFEFQSTGLKFWTKWPFSNIFQNALKLLSSMIWWFPAAVCMLSGCSPLWSCDFQLLSACSQATLLYVFSISSSRQHALNLFSTTFFYQNRLLLPDQHNNRSSFWSFVIGSKKNVFIFEWCTKCVL